MYYFFSRRVVDSGTTKCWDVLVGQCLVAYLQYDPQQSTCAFHCQASHSSASVDLLASQRASGNSEGTDPEEGKLDVRSIAETRLTLHFTDYCTCQKIFADLMFAHFWQNCKLQHLIPRKHFRLHGMPFRLVAALFEWSNESLRWTEMVTSTIVQWYAEELDYITIIRWD